MTRRWHEMVCILLLTSLPVLAENEPVKKPATTIEVVARLHDGTTIRKAVIEEKVELVTKYGKLTVPVGDIRRIEFGLHLSDETTAQVERAIKNLGSDKFAERETASKEVVSLGCRAYPALQAAAASKDKETAKRAADAIERIRATVADELLKLKNHDVIHTRDSVVGGTISNAVIKARTKTLGELQFKIEDLQSLHSMARTEAAVAVEPPADRKLKWLDSGVFVETDMDLILRRSGEIELAVLPQANGRPLVPATPAADKLAHPGGTLLGKIGDKGDTFAIGQRFEGKAVQEGRLYLAVVPYPVLATGRYQVDIQAGLELAPGLKRMERVVPAPPMPAYFGTGFSGPRW